MLSLFDDVTKDALSPGFNNTILYGAIKPSDVTLTENADGMELAKLAAQYADGIIMGSENVDASLKEHCSKLGVPVLPYEEGSFQDGSYMDRYNAFYDDLLK